MKPIGNKQGFCVLMNFNTGVEVTLHGNITELTITDVIIKYVELMASCQTIQLLKIHNREKFIYNPNNWISGSEYKK